MTVTYLLHKFFLYVSISHFKNAIRKITNPEFLVLESYMEESGKGIDFRRVEIEVLFYLLC